MGTRIERNALLSLTSATLDKNVVLRERIWRRASLKLLLRCASIEYKEIYTARNSVWSESKLE